ncbi:FAD-dependent oxidoreductase [Lichenicoccus sp.]|uniref:FAD-dependent oxidoreductase n=1 Tax=Lichenicoccus sp. TaxID=2781899 RepID=UPI003D10A148
MSSRHYDAVVLGSGEGGKYIAWHLARSGRRTAVVERRLIGGSCPNTNCLPTKNEIWSAKVAFLARNGREFGTMTGGVSVDMAQVLKRKRDMVDGLVAMHLENFRESGAVLIMGEGRFVAPRTLDVSLNEGGSSRLTCDQLILSVGSRAALPSVPGLAESTPLTNLEILELDALPQHLIVLGGGYVGLELAQAFGRFGSRVTIVEHGPQLAGREDPDIAEQIQQVLEEEGLEVLLSSTVLNVDGTSGQTVELTIQTPTGMRSIAGSHILVAAGRRPNTSGIGLDLAGVELEANGYIRVDEHLATTATETWAVGECAGSPAFTHVAFDDFRVVRDRLAGGSRSTKGRLVPYCMFTDPPLGRVGLNETDARRQGIDVRVARIPMEAILRTRTIGETTGFAKVLVSAHSDQIIGFSMVGPDAGEVVAVVQTAMLAQMPYTGLRDALLAHPTMAEGLGSLMTRVPVIG